MDKNSHARKKYISTDGFVTSRPLTNPGNNSKAYNQYHSSKKNTQSSPSSRPIDSFNRSIDGFKPSSRPIVPRSGNISSDLPVPNFSSSRVKKDDRLLNSASVSARRGLSSNSMSSASSKEKRTGLGWLRRKNRHQRTRKQKIFLRTIMVSGALLVLVGSGIVLKGILLGRNIFKGGGSSAVLHNQDVDPSLLKGEGDGRINIMVLGKGGAEQKDGPDLTDTIIIASIDPIAHEAALLSVPRDFWIKSPSGGQTKINQVYYDAKNKALNSLPSNQRNSDDAKDKSESAGVQAVEKVINDTLGIPVHYYSMIDFAGFKKAIDTVDGVDIDVNEDMAVQENMWINGRYVLDVKPGKQHFDGMRALAFSRSRKTSSRGDFARSDRQRAVMVGFKDKALNTGTLANPVKINQLMSDFSGQLGTDFSVNEILRLYDLAKEIPSNKITSVNLNDHVVGDTINSLSVQVPKAGLFEYGELKNYVRNTLRDAFLKREDAKIMILNGTEKAGLATAKSNDLKSYGYNISSVGDAPTKQYKDTVLVDLRNGSKKYTKSYLEKRLKITASSSLPDSSISTGDADFVIILGSNETSR